MVARPGSYQASNNAGELAPELHGRTDLKQYKAGVALMLNAEPVPQGGSRLSPRSRFLGRVRRRLAALTVTSGSFSNGPYNNAAVIALLGFSVPTQVSVVTFIAFVCSAGDQIGAAHIVEWQDAGLAWHTFGPAAFAVPSLPARAVAIALPPGSSVSCVGIRLRLFANPPANTFYATTAIELLAETTVLPVLRLKPFTFALDQTYAAIVTSDLIDFWRDGVWVGAARFSFTDAQVKEIDIVQRLDTMMIFHRDVPTLRIMRSGSDAAWWIDGVPYTGIPQVDLGGAYTNQVADKWDVFITYSGADITVSISVNGASTPALAVPAGPDWPAFATAMQAAIEALPGVGAGITLTEDHSTAGYTILHITFGGADSLGQTYVLAASVQRGGGASTVHSQIGLPGGEPLISAPRGFPACGAFYQDRLVIGGFKSKTGAFEASNTADYFDLDITVTAQTGAILANLDTQGAERLQHIVASRYLLFFTSDGEYFVSDRALNKQQPPNIVSTSRNGTAPNVPVVESEGTLLYLAPDFEDPERKGKLLFSMTFDAINTAYTSDPISLLASHIVNQVTGLALQRGAAATDANRLWMTRADGSMTEGIMMRGQEVTAFARWQTAGQVLDVMVDGLNRPHIAVQRMVGGVAEIHFERLELGLLFDGTIEQTFGAATATVTGLDAHQGASVWAQADGFVVGPFTVTNATITLPSPASHVLVGRWTAPAVDTLPLPTEVAPGVVLRRPRRVHAVRLDLLATTSVAIGANDEAPEDVPLYFDGQATDAPPPPFSGLAAVEGMVGHTIDGTVRITQLRPGALAWRGITIEAK